MNAEETLGLFRKRYDVTLPSGMNVTIRLPRMRDCIIAGGVPLPVAQILGEAGDKAKENGQTPALSAEQIEAGTRLQDEVVRQTLVAVEGQPVEMTSEAVRELDASEPEDYAALAGWGQRTTPVPTTASSPA